MTDASTILFDVCKIMPSEMHYDVVGGSIDGGRSLSGASQTVDISGGGLVAVTYAGITLLTRDQHRYWNEIAALLNGGVRDIYLPLLTDVLQDPPAPAAGTAAAAALHATSLTITAAAAVMFAGNWFSIQHSHPLGWRSYRIVSVAGSVVEIRPALRAAITAGQSVRFDRPRCAMKLPGGDTMEWSYVAPGAFAADLSINFVESF